MMLIIIILLTIIAVGVLFQSREGKRFLNSFHFFIEKRTILWFFVILGSVVTFFIFLLFALEKLGFLNLFEVSRYSEICGIVLGIFALGCMLWGGPKILLLAEVESQRYKRKRALIEENVNNGLPPVLTNNQKKSEAESEELFDEIESLTNPITNEEFLLKIRRKFPDFDSDPYPLPLDRQALSYNQSADVSNRINKFLRDYPEFKKLLKN